MLSKSSKLQSWPKFFKTLIVLSVLLLALNYNTTSFAEYISPDQVQVSTPRYMPNFKEFEPKLGTYKYEVSWQGIPAAEAELKVEHNGSNYILTATARTYSPIDLIYDMKYKAEGILSLADLSPIKTTIYQKENSRIKNTEIKFLDSGEIYAVRSQNNDEPEKTIKFDPKNFTLEPFSAALLAKALPWTEGQSRTFDTFNGKSRYMITLTATAKEKMDFEGREIEVFRIEPKVKNLTNSSNDSKLKNAQIYVTADENQDIVKIASKVFIGTVNTKLIGFVPDSTGAKTVIARK